MINNKNLLKYICFGFFCVFLTTFYIIYYSNNNNKYTKKSSKNSTINEKVQGKYWVFSDYVIDKKMSAGFGTDYDLYTVYYFGEDNVLKIFNIRNTYSIVNSKGTRMSFYKEGICNYKKYDYTIDDNKLTLNINSDTKIQKSINMNNDNNLIIDNKAYNKYNSINSILKVSCNE